MFRPVPPAPTLGAFFTDAAWPGWLAAALGLVAIGLLHVPLFPIAPFYTSTVWYCLRRYRQDHRRAHLDPRWGRDHLSWHYDHHMGDQDKNFGVVWSWFDSLVGTRDLFVGSDKERALHDKHAQRAETAKAGAELRAQRRNPLRRLVRALSRSGSA